MLPFLAAAIPIYLGPSDVTELFNERAFVNCAALGSLEACAERVREVKIAVVTKKRPLQLMFKNE